MQITFNNTSFNLVEDSNHEFLLSNKEVALGYGITQSALRSNQNNHKDELIENKHWLRLEVQTNGGKQKVIHWTKKGIVRLGFFIKSKNAKEFRDWAEDYIVNTPTKPQQPTHKKDPYIYNLERENVELKRAINRLTYNQEKQENCINTTKFSEIMNKVQTKLYNQADEAIVLAHKELTDMLYKNKSLLN